MVAQVDAVVLRVRVGGEVQSAQWSCVLRPNTQRRCHRSNNAFKMVLHSAALCSSAQSDRWMLPPVVVHLCLLCLHIVIGVKNMNQEVQDFTMSGKATLSILLLKPRRFSPALIGGLQGQPNRTFGRLRHDRVGGGKSSPKHHRFVSKPMEPVPTLRSLVPCNCTRKNSNLKSIVFLSQTSNRTKLKSSRPKHTTLANGIKSTVAQTSASMTQSRKMHVFQLIMGCIERTRAYPVPLFLVYRTS